MIAVGRLVHRAGQPVARGLAALHRRAPPTTACCSWPWATTESSASPVARAGGRPGGGHGPAAAAASAAGNICSSAASPASAGCSVRRSATEASWLLPAALIGLVAGLVADVAHRRAPAGCGPALLLWGGWLLVTGAVFSFMDGTVHPYYTVALAPAIAALVGISVRRTVAPQGAPGCPPTLAVMLAATGAWAFVLLGRTPEWLPALRWVVLAGCGVGGGGARGRRAPLGRATRGGRRRRGGVRARRAGRPSRSRTPRSRTADLAPCRAPPRRAGSAVPVARRQAVPAAEGPGARRQRRAGRPWSRASTTVGRQPAVGSFMVERPGAQDRRVADGDRRLHRWRPVAHAGAVPAVRRRRAGALLHRHGPGRTADRWGTGPVSPRTSPRGSSSTSPRRDVGGTTVYDLQPQA